METIKVTAVLTTCICRTGASLPQMKTRVAKVPTSISRAGHQRIGGILYRLQQDDGHVVVLRPSASELLDGVDEQTRNLRRRESMGRKEQFL